MWKIAPLGQCNLFEVWHVWRCCILKLCSKCSSVKRFRNLFLIKFTRENALSQRYVDANMVQREIAIFFRFGNESTGTNSVENWAAEQLANFCLRTSFSWNSMSSIWREDWREWNERCACWVKSSIESNWTILHVFRHRHFIRANLKTIPKMWIIRVIFLKSARAVQKGFAGRIRPAGRLLRITALYDQCSIKLI